MQSNIEKFLSSPAFAVIGASQDRYKFGNKVLRCYLRHHAMVYPVNPHVADIEGLPCIKQIIHLPPEVKSISIVTPPAVTEEIVEEAIKKGIKHIWMQPGAESAAAIMICEKHGINVIAGGPCILLTLGGDV